MLDASDSCRNAVFAQDGDDYGWLGCIVAVSGEHSRNTHYSPRFVATAESTVRGVSTHMVSESDNIEQHRSIDRSNVGCPSSVT